MFPVPLILHCVCRAEMKGTDPKCLVLYHSRQLFAPVAFRTQVSRKDLPAHTDDETFSLEFTCFS